MFNAKNHVFTWVKNHCIKPPKSQSNMQTLSRSSLSNIIFTCHHYVEPRYLPSASHLHRLATERSRSYLYHLPRISSWPQHSAWRHFLEACTGSGRAERGSGERPRKPGWGWLERAHNLVIFLRLRGLAVPSEVEFGRIPLCSPANCLLI